ncbi:hypothetical protein [Pseudarthrobacter sp. S9]|uniref:hypothetical protein n=1 Tax=Pseudarthrobacter sp. S9 TaxID=3418421 RepID=UPI003D0752A9
MFVTTGVTFAAPAQASDMSGPALVSQSVTSTNLNLHNGPATINVTIHLVDDTAVQSPTMIANWVDPDPWGWVYGGGQSQGFGGMTLVSGTMQDGIWKHTIVIPQGAATGQWEVVLYPLRDTWGNSSSGFRTLDTVTVIDEAPPTTVSPAAVAFTDTDGIKDDTYTVPTKTGVQYLIEGKEVSAGTYPGTGKVTVTAKARTGYVLASNVPSSWTMTFKGLLVGSTPTISGAGQVGSTLTANASSWGPSPVILAYQWYRSGVAIAGANAVTYALAVADARNTITVSVTGSKAGYSTVTKKSAPTAAVANGSLSATPIPTITGTPQVGQTLTATAGIWAPSPASFSYQWYRAGVLITGANAATYTPTASDVATSLTVKVTGSKSGYTTVAKTSAPTAGIAKGSLTRSTPAVTGTPMVGTTLTAAPGVWGPAPVTLRYQWYRSGTLIIGASSATYTPVPEDLGAILTVKVTGSKTGFTTFSRTSAPTAAVLKGSLVRATPTITGTAQVGSTLTANPGTWGPSPVTLRYQWYRSGIAITGANAATYKPTTTDAAKTLTVKVTGSKTGYTTFSRTSAPTAAVAK